MRRLPQAGSERRASAPTGHGKLAHHGNQRVSVFSDLLWLEEGDSVMQRDAVRN
jgi:hypothetical protein